MFLAIFILFIFLACEKNLHNFLTEEDEEFLKNSKQVTFI